MSQFADAPGHQMTVVRCCLLALKSDRVRTVVPIFLLHHHFCGWSVSARHHRQLVDVLYPPFSCPLDGGIKLSNQKPFTRRSWQLTP